MRRRRFEVRLRRALRQSSAACDQIAAVCGDAGAEPHSGTEVIGFDPIAGKVRSWVFESDGSFSENLWTQDGRRWLIQARVTLPDGTQATAQHTLSWKDKDKFTWTSANRERDGELLPNIGPIEIVRGK